MGAQNLHALKSSMDKMAGSVLELADHLRGCVQHEGRCAHVAHSTPCSGQSACAGVGGAPLAPQAVSSLWSSSLSPPASPGSKNTNIAEHNLPPPSHYHMRPESMDTKVGQKAAGELPTDAEIARRSLAHSPGDGARELQRWDAGSACGAPEELESGALEGGGAAPERGSAASTGAAELAGAGPCPAADRPEQQVPCLPVRRCESL